MNVLILVLSARREPWDKLMDVQMETWDSELNLQAPTLYYCGRYNNTDVKYTTDKVFYSPELTESLEDVSPRTIEAFEKALELPDWHYLARPHSSTYVHKANLLKFCETLPTTNVLCGIETGGENSFIWGGGHFLFSRDVIAWMVHNKGQWDTDLMDDQSITKMAKELGVPVTPGRTSTINFQPDGSYLTLVYNHGSNFTHTDFDGIGKKLDGHFFVRVKHDPDRTVDLKIMRELHKHWQ